MTDFALTDRDLRILHSCSAFEAGLDAIRKNLIAYGQPISPLALRTRVGTLVARGYLREVATILPGGERVALYASSDPEDDR